MCSTDTNHSHNDLGLTDKNHACACGTADHAATDVAAAATANATEEHFLVSGMTCGHCVSSVTEEVSAIDGVESVSVALNASGASDVTVVSSGPISPEAVRAAVEEAGYTFVAS
jgi:copper chaperone